MQNVGLLIALLCPHVTLLHHSRKMLICGYVFAYSYLLCTPNIRESYLDWETLSHRLCLLAPCKQEGNKKSTKQRDRRVETYVKISVEFYVNGESFMQYTD